MQQYTIDIEFVSTTFLSLFKKAVKIMFGYIYVVVIVWTEVKQKKTGVVLLKAAQNRL